MTLFQEVTQKFHKHTHTHTSHKLCDNFLYLYKLFPRGLTLYISGSASDKLWDHFCLNCTHFLNTLLDQVRD